MAGEPQVTDSQVDGANDAPDTDDIDKIWAELAALEKAEASGDEAGENPAATAKGDDAGEGDGQTGDAEGTQPPPNAVGVAAETQPKNLTEMTREELIAERAALQQQLALAQHSDASQRGRISALTKQLNEIRAGGKPPAEDRRAKLKQTREEFPELAPVIETLEEFQSETEARRQDEFREQVRRNTETVEQTHPGYSALISQNADLFQAYMARAPQAVRDAFEQNAVEIVDPANAIHVIGAFKGFLASQGKAVAPSGKPAPQGAPQPKSQDRRERQLAAAASTPPSRGSVSPGNPTGSGSEDGDWDYWRRVDEAKKQRRR